MLKLLQRMRTVLWTVPLSVKFRPSGNEEEGLKEFYSCLQQGELGLV